MVWRLMPKTVSFLQRPALNCAMTCFHTSVFALLCFVLSVEHCEIQQIKAEMLRDVDMR